MRLKLTKSAIDGIEAPAKGRIVLVDTATPGLSVVITKNNARTYYVIRWANGRVKWIRLGPVAELTVDAARRKARPVNSDLASDVDPNAIKRQAREAATLAEVWTAYRETIKKAPKTMLEDAGLWARYLEPWAAKRISDIAPDDVQRLYTRVAAGNMERESMDRFGNKHKIKGGPSAARHAVKLLREIFNAMGKTKTFKVAENPAKDVQVQKAEAQVDISPPKKCHSFGVPCRLKKMRRCATPSRFPCFSDSGTATRWPCNGPT